MKLIVLLVPWLACVMLVNVGSGASGLVLPGAIPEDVLNSFAEEYRPIIQSLPPSLQPKTTTHGKHSYTVRLEGANDKRVEVLLRQRALKAKGVKCKSPQGCISDSSD